MSEPLSGGGTKSVSGGAGLLVNDVRRRAQSEYFAEPPQSKRCVFLHRKPAFRRPEQR